MSLNVDGKGRCLARLGDNLIFLDTESKSGSKEMRASRFDQNKFEHVPDIHKRETVLISGPAGSGKSWYCRGFIENFQELFPHFPVYIISRSKDDPAFADLDNVHIIPSELIEDPETQLNPDEFKQCLVVMDDIDQFNKPALEKVQLLRKQLLELGRKNQCYICNTNHMLMNYRGTRDLINESACITLFPACNWYQIHRFLREYCGFDRNTIQKIKNTTSRWVTIFMHYPKCVLEEKKVWIP